MGSHGGASDVSGTAWQGRQVLIIEPDDGLAVPLAASLRSQGADVTRVVDGRSALAHLRGHAPDAVLLAAPLPDADWSSLAAWIHHEPEPPVLIVLGAEAIDAANTAAWSHGDEPDAVLERRAKPDDVCLALAAAWGFRSGDSPRADPPPSLPSLLLGVRDTGESGVLEIRADGVCTRIFFRRGAPVFAEGGALRETLGRMLLQRGALTEAEYLRVIERMTERLMESETTRMGEVLVELGLLTPAEVFAALSDQVREKILGCFHGAQFTHAFEPADSLDEGMCAYPALPLEPLLLAGLRTHFGPDRLEPLLAPLSDRRPALVEDLTSSIARFELSPAEQRLLRLVDGKRTLAAIRATAPLDPVHTAQVFAALVLAKGIVWGEAPEDRQAGRARTARERGEAAAVARPAPARVEAPSPPSRQNPAVASAAASPPPGSGAPRSLARLRSALALAGREMQLPIDPKSAGLEAERAFRQGLQRLEHSAPAGALRAFGRACALRPEEPEYRMYEAWAALLAAPDEETRIAARAKAASCAKRMLQRDRDSARAHGILGQILLASGDAAGAEGHFRSVLRVAPEDRDALRGLRLVERRRGHG